MKTRYKIIIVIVSILASLQIVTTADCLVDEGQPGLFICTGPGLNFILPQAFAQCIENEDWPDAPCLDTIGNGWYGQDQVDRWSDYYSYKGSEIMETKYLELNNAIIEDRVEEWTRESHENLNVYQYYFFSGRAPNTGEYTGAFDVIPVNEEGAPEDNKPTYVNLTPILSYDNPFINSILIMAGLGAGVSATVVFVVKRKRK